ncbi:MAG: hypothetical protein QOF87_4114 [Pseudonocardiales bacterium]|nr:hypothetical protein [Pseudonocardiales bacterium]
MRRGHRIAISAIAATALTAGGCAALVAGPHAQAAKAVGRPVSATSPDTLAEFARLQADVVTNHSRLDAMTRAISLAQARIRAQAKRQAALALLRAEADAADKSTAVHAVAAQAAHPPPIAMTAPAVVREPTQPIDDATAAPAAAPPSPAAASTTPEAEPTTPPPGDDDDDHRGDGA